VTEKAANTASVMTSWMILSRAVLNSYEPMRLGGNLKTVFEKGDTPAGEDNLPQRFAAVFEVAVPGEGHENVGDGEQSDGAQGASWD